MIAEAMHRTAYRLAIGLMVPLLLAAPLLVPRTVEAADFTSRRVHMADARASVTTSHEVSFDFVTGASVGSLEFEYCSNSPLPGTVCTPPTGMDATGLILSSESGETGFSVHPSTSAHRIVLTRTASVVVPQNSIYLLSNIVNPDTVGSHYVRLASFASADASGSRIDEGGVAISINDPLNFSTFVPPILLFCLGTSIPLNNCASATGDTIDFGEFSEAATSSGTTQMLAATNGFGGYNITVTGTTMTSGNNTIPGLPSPASSSTGISQFGLNLVNNSVPNIGINPTGPGTGSPTNDYDNINQYKFSNGDVVARSTNSTDINRYTTSYIVNISPDQRAGVYATTLTYIAFANF